MDLTKQAIYLFIYGLASIGVSGYLQQRFVSVCLSAPLIMQLGERKEVCLQCLADCWSFDLLMPLLTPCRVGLHVCLSLALIVKCVSSLVFCVKVRARTESVLCL